MKNKTARRIADALEAIRNELELAKVHQRLYGTPGTEQLIRDHSFAFQKCGAAKLFDNDLTLFCTRFPDHSGKHMAPNPFPWSGGSVHEWETVEEEQARRENEPPSSAAESVDPGSWLATDTQRCQASLATIQCVLDFAHLGDHMGEPGFVNVIGMSLSGLVIWRPLRAQEPDIDKLTGTSADDLADEGLDTPRHPRDRISTRCQAKRLFGKDEFQCERFEDHGTQVPHHSYIGQDPKRFEQPPLQWYDDATFPPVEPLP